MDHGRPNETKVHEEEAIDHEEAANHLIGIKPSAGNLPTSNEFTCERRAYHVIVLLCNDANDICCISLLLEIRRSFLFDQMRVDKLERNYSYIFL